MGILGYGVRGMRVYDFGWVGARKTWEPGKGIMRLQMHTTDPRNLRTTVGNRAIDGLHPYPCHAERTD